MYLHGFTKKWVAFSRTSSVENDLSTGVPHFAIRLAAANEVVNGNNLRVALVMTSATFNDVHASCRVWETERCKPFDIYEWTGNIQVKLWRKVKYHMNLSRA